MNNPTRSMDDEMPAEIDFGRATRVSIEKKVWEYFSGKAAQQGVELSTLLSDVLSRDIEINEALR